MGIKSLVNWLAHARDNEVVQYQKRKTGTSELC